MSPENKTSINIYNPNSGSYKNSERKINTNSSNLNNPANNIDNN